MEGSPEHFAASDWFILYYVSTGLQ